MPQNNTSNGNVEDPLGAFSSSDTASNQSSSSNNASPGPDSSDDYLRSIDATLKSILQNSSMSQANARDSFKDSKDVFRNKHNARMNNPFGRKDSFADGIYDGFLEGIGLGDMKDKMHKAVSSFAEEFGLDLNTVRQDLGKELGKRAADAFKNSKFGQSVNDAFGKYKDKAVKGMGDKFRSGLGKYDKANGTDYVSKFDKVKDAVKGAVNSKAPAGAGEELASGADAVASNLAGAEAGGIADVGAGLATVSEGASGLGASLAGAAAAAGPAIAAFAAVTAGALILDAALDAVSPAIEGTKKLLEASSKAMNRAQESRQKNLEYEQERIRADVETLIEYPFEILKNAAEDLYQAWDNNIQKINGTQGYTKDQLSSLISDYATRLRNEGLSGVISSADITDNLAKVLDSGLSGYAAEEFSYIATILNNAIPTQDFFSYADTYAALAGTKISQGYSQADAIAYANTQLEAFANNILYANRNIAGGFTTGLQDASSLLTDAVKIAQSAKSDNVAGISGVLTSVSAIVGSVAPDLASSITDAVVKASTGGNSSELVALRSLAGVNASNTEFLKKLADDPQKIFSTLFTNLANMQNMSNNAFMEVAEGVSSVFGMSMDAFARIDFNYLAQAITNMNTDSGSLNDNLKLLAEGQTTTSTEMLRMQQVNQYMIDEGLAYVLDNEATRQIQQHMWDEQMHRESLEATYAVELKGAALEFLEGIRSTIENILGFLNPFMLIGKTVQLIGTAQESVAQSKDLISVLNAVKVGNANIKDLYNLTTTNANLGLTGNLAELLTGKSSYARTSKGRRLVAGAYGYNASTTGAGYLAKLGLNAAVGAGAIEGALSTSGRRKSQYTWGITKKSDVAEYGTAAKAVQAAASSSKQSSKEAAEKAATKLLAARMTKAIGRMSDTVKDKETGKESLKYASYDAWKTSASKGIKDWDSALDAAGLSESQLEQQFQDLQAQQGAKEQQDRLNTESQFWNDGSTFWNADKARETEMNFWSKTLEFEDAQFNKTKDIYNLLDKTTNSIYLNGIKSEFSKWVTDWTNYYINHTAYGTGAGEVNANGGQTYSYRDIADIAAKEKNESYDAVHALAEALNKNILDLHDPTVQTNALLGKILLVVEAMLQQAQGGTANVSLIDSLTALATGK